MNSHWQWSEKWTPRYQSSSLPRLIGGAHVPSSSSSSPVALIRQWARPVFDTELQLKPCNPRWTGTLRLLGVTRKRDKASAPQLPFRFPVEHDRRINPGPDLRHWGEPTKRWERCPAAVTSCSSCGSRECQTFVDALSLKFAKVCLEWGETWLKVCLFNWNHLRSGNELRVKLFYCVTAVLLLHKAGSLFWHSCTLLSMPVAVSECWSVELRLKRSSLVLFPTSRLLHYSFSSILSVH